MYYSSADEPAKELELLTAALNPNHLRIQKVLPEGVQLDVVVFLFCFFDEGKQEKRIQKALKAGHHPPASETPKPSKPSLSQNEVEVLKLCDFSRDWD